MTGAPAESPAPALEIPAFGWRELWPIQADNEYRVATTLAIKYGLEIEPAGARSQSYDLRVKLTNGPFAQTVGIPTGNYEVKSLWRRNENCAFDRRFKLGQRGERIYGMRDSRIKAFAVGLDTEIESIMENSITYPIGERRPNEMRLFFDETTEFIKQAVERRHSKDFEVRLNRLASVCQVIPTMTTLARGIMNSTVQPIDIAKGFADVEGIFVTAGPIYTLITTSEIKDFLAFDSASSEGPKVRYTKIIPSETNRNRKARNGI